MNRYRLEFAEDWDDGNPTHFDSPSKVIAGDIIPTSDGFHHLVLEVRAANCPEPLLVLGKAGQGPQGAIEQTLRRPPS